MLGMFYAVILSEFEVNPRVLIGTHRSRIRKIESYNYYKEILICHFQMAAALMVFSPLLIIILLVAFH